MKTEFEEKLKSLLENAGALVAVLLLALTTGCGSTKVSTQNNTNASVGQQLMDLDKAHRDGLVSDKDYARLKASIVKKNE